MNVHVHAREPWARDQNIAGDMNATGETGAPDGQRTET